MTAVSLIVLATVMTYRFAIPLVDPPPPTPDYAVQALVAGVAMATAVAGGLGAGVYATKREVARGRIVGMDGCRHARWHPCRNVPGLRAERTLTAAADARQRG